MNTSFAVRLHSVICSFVILSSIAPVSSSVKWDNNNNTYLVGLLQKSMQKHLEQYLHAVRASAGGRRWHLVSCRTSVSIASAKDFMHLESKILIQLLKWGKRQMLDIYLEMTIPIDSRLGFQ